MTTNSDIGPARDVLLIWAYPWQPEHGEQTSPLCHACFNQYSRWVVNFAQGIKTPVEPFVAPIADRRRFNLVHHDVIVEQDSGDYAF